MANINVSYAEMEQAAVQLGSGREEITQRLHDMRARIADLVTSGFVTEQASVKFDSAFAEYTNGAKTVAARLTEIEDFLRRSAHTIREMDSQIAARIN